MNGRAVVSPGFGVKPTESGCRMMPSSAFNIERMPRVMTSYHKRLQNRVDLHPEKTRLLEFGGCNGKAKRQGSKPNHLLSRLHLSAPEPEGYATIHVRTMIKAPQGLNEIAHVQAPPS